MKKLKIFFKKYYIYMLAFIIPMIIFVIGLTLAKFLPFGNQTIEIYDGYFQYPGFAAYYSNVLKGTESLLYSFKGALGYNFYAVAVYYLFNPTSLLLYFFNSGNLYIFYTITIILKVGLCGLSCSILLKYLKRSNVSTFLFSTAYALCAYNLLYFSNYMWIDSLFLLPLVIIGLNKLIYENKKLMYFITLSISIISNFYLGYMICIFSLLYFILKFFSMKKDKRRKGLIKDFVVMSVFSGLVSAFVLLPVTLELFMGKNALYNGDVGFTKYFKFDFDFINMFYKFSLASSTGKDISYGTPNIYCSLLALIYFIFSFFNKSFTKREKICNLVLFLYFTLCFSFNLLDFSWQLFQQPIWYPVRYAFVFDLFIILIASKCFDKRENISLKLVFKLLIVTMLLGIFILSIKLNNISISSLKDIEFIGLILSIVVLFEYISVINSKFKIGIIFIIIIFFIEITFNTITTFKILASGHSVDFEKITYNSNNNIFNLIKQNDNNFYRLESNSKHIYNNGAFYNYNGINFFSSVRNNNVINFLDFYTDTKVVDYCSITYNFLNPILNDLLGIKYITSGNQMMYYNVAFKDNSGIYLNKDAFNLGYLVNNNIFDVILEEDEYNDNYSKIVDGMLGKKLNIGQKLNGIINNATIIDNKYKRIDETEDANITYNVNESGFIIIDRETQQFDIESLKINDTIVSNSFASFIYIDSNETAELKLNIKSKADISKTDAYFIPYDKYVEFVTSIKSSEMEITNYKNDSYFEGKVKSTVEKNVLFTTIPYDKGWNIYVDGEKYNYKSALNNAFIALELNPGEHNIVFRYIPRGLILGIILSLLGLITGILYLLKDKLFKKHLR